MTEISTPERLELKMHANLLWHVIKEQAGTMSKALLETIMNSVDAGASSCAITVDEDGSHLQIVDDGRGFQAREEIEEHFRTFGTPHTDGDGAQFGRFRVGRAQMWGYGQNCWRSSCFEMNVDLKRLGLAFELKTDLPLAPGCRIDVHLYEPLLPSEIDRLRRDLSTMAKWVQIPVTFDGTEITTGRKNVVWDLETPEAYFKLRAGSGSLSVYNLGVLVRSYGQWEMGLAGEVISKVPLEVNMARNDIQSGGEVWKRIKKTIQGQAGVTVAKKTTPLTDDEREYLATSFADGTVTPKEFEKARTITDVSGEHLSLSALLRRLRDTGIRTLSVAPLHDQRGDVLQQHQLAIVLAQTTLDRFHVTSIDALLTLFREKGVWPYEAAEITSAEFSVLSANLSTTHLIVDPARLTPTEQLLRDFLQKQSQILDPGSSWADGRKILVGESDAAEAWTDGKTYIAIHRKFLKHPDMHVEDWVRLGALLVHEYAHNDDNSGTHVHGPDFYADTERMMRSGLPRFANHCVCDYPEALRNRSRALGREVLRLEDRRVKIQRDADTFTTKVAEFGDKVSQVDDARHGPPLGRRRRSSHHRGCVRRLVSSRRNRLTV
jgi:hypothetical protein